MMTENKNEQSRLEELKSLSYHTILKKKDQSFYLFIPELSIVAESTTLAGAYETLEDEKESYFKKMIAMDAENDIRKPAGLQMKRKLSEELLSFSIKILVVVFFLGALLIGSRFFVDHLVYERAVQLRSAVGAYVTGMPLVVLREYSTRFNRMTPDQKERLLAELRRLSLQLKPFIGEIRVLFQDSAIDETESKDR